MKAGGPVAVVGANLVNVSPYGMLIHSPLPMEPDAVHKFRLLIEKQERDVEARVAMCERDGRHRYGVGLEFVGLVDELRSRLIQILTPLTSNS
jgi:PilZ domain